MIQCLPVLLLVLAAGSASAQTVWRCGPEGRSYSDTPCPGGQTVAVADPRSPADVAQARAVAERERHLAQQLVQERRAREQEARSHGSGLMAVKPPDPVKLRVARADPQWQPLPKPKRPPAAAGTSRATARDSRPTRG